VSETAAAQAKTLDDYLRDCWVGHTGEQAAGRAALASALAADPVLANEAQMRRDRITDDMTLRCYLSQRERSTLLAVMPAGAS
jgi:hypothetical protein